MAKKNNSNNPYYKDSNLDNNVLEKLKKTKQKAPNTKNKYSSKKKSTKSCQYAHINVYNNGVIKAFRHIIYSKSILTSKYYPRLESLHMLPYMVSGSSLIT